MCFCPIKSHLLNSTCSTSLVNTQGLFSMLRSSCARFLQYYTINQPEASIPSPQTPQVTVWQLRQRSHPPNKPGLLKDGKASSGSWSGSEGTMPGPPTTTACKGLRILDENWEVRVPSSTQAIITNYMEVPRHIFPARSSATPVSLRFVSHNIMKYVTNNWISFQTA